MSYATWTTHVLHGGSDCFPNMLLVEIDENTPRNVVHRDHFKHIHLGGQLHMFWRTIDFGGIGEQNPRGISPPRSGGDIGYGWGKG